MITHELKRIFKAGETAKTQNLKAVLATVVALDGSSYRRPGVRMLVLEDGKMIGAVSGGCVEKEVLRQALTVFKTGVSKIMTYDGRYRLGCEGLLYILLEPFKPAEGAVQAFWNTIKNRSSFSIESYFEKRDNENENYGSLLKLGNKAFPVSDTAKASTELLQLEQTMPPCFRLVIIGTEHDAVQLCSMASMMGWEVTVVANPKEQKSIQDFPGVTDFINAEPETFAIATDDQTAIVLMTHSFVKDLQFLMTLRTTRASYFGILGPARRREKLFDELLEQCPETSLEFIEAVHGPAGLDIGAETPQEIAISVLSEILTVINKKDATPLREKEGRIHA